jgi:hypothetical protein
MLCIGTTKQLKNLAYIAGAATAQTMILHPHAADRAVRFHAVVDAPPSRLLLHCPSNKTPAVSKARRASLGRKRPKGQHVYATHLVPLQMQFVHDHREENRTRGLPQIKP